MLLFLMTARHLSVSVFRNRSNWTRDIGAASEARSASCFTTFGSARTALISVLSFLAMSAGMPEGPTTLVQVNISARDPVTMLDRAALPMV
jgi:hypothetical protein